MIDEPSPEVCSCCGEPLDDEFEALVADLEEITAGHEEGDVVSALCLMLGGILAEAEPGDRPRLRRIVGSLISDATKMCAETAQDAAPARPGLH